jgi:hypothetical protein
MEDKWKKDLQKLMLKGDSEIFSCSCINLRKNNCPKTLFKYCSYSKNSLDSLENEYLYLSDIDKVNDPLECFIEAGNHRVDLVRKYFDQCEEKSNLFPTKTSEDDFCEKITKGATFKGEFLNVILDKNPSSFANTIIDETFQNQADEIDNYDLKMASKIKDAIRDNYYIGCLSERNDIITMWSYYANNHKGFVIEYELTDEQKNHCFPVFYTPRPINYDDFNKNPTFYYLLCLKFNEWVNEKEWRIIYGSEEGHKIPLKVKGVYFGVVSYDKYNEKESIENTIKINKIINKLNVPTFKMIMDKSNYKLTSVPCYIPSSYK